MAQIIKVLDVFQGEKYTYLGCLLFNLITTMRKLKKTKNRQLRIIFANLYSIEVVIWKFGSLFIDLECQLAAAFLSMFRQKWFEHHEASQVNKMHKAMETIVEAAIR